MQIGSQWRRDLNLSRKDWYRYLLWMDSQWSGGGGWLGTSRDQEKLPTSLAQLTESFQPVAHSQHNHCWKMLFSLWTVAQSLFTGRQSLNNVFFLWQWCLMNVFLCTSKPGQQQNKQSVVTKVDNERRRGRRRRRRRTRIFNCLILMFCSRVKVLSQRVKESWPYHL